MHPRVIQQETGLPLGIDTASGELVRFEELVADPERLGRLKELDPGEQKALALTRIEGFERWPTRVILPDGIVDRARAVQAIRDDEELAPILVATEMRVVAIVRALIGEEAQDG
jgi:hypothetical protein